MSRRCALTGRGVMSGNNVSHAVNRTRRRFLPNLQQTRLYSDALSQYVKMRLSVRTLRTIDAKGGLDAFLLNTAARKLTDEAKKLRNRVRNALVSNG